MAPDLLADEEGLLGPLLGEWERQRRRAVDDLHDRVLQLLGLVGLRADLLAETALAGDAERALATLTATRDALQAAVAVLRGIMLDCRPFDLGRETLADALSDYLSQFAAATGARVRLAAARMPASGDVRHLLAYRFVQSLLGAEREEARPWWVTVQVSPNRVAVSLRPHFTSVPGGRRGPLRPSDIWDRELALYLEVLGATAAVEGEPPYRVVVRLPPARSTVPRAKDLAAERR